MYTESMKQMRYTITDLQNDFPDEAACLNWLKEYLYPNGIYCKVDKKVTPHHQMKTRRSFSCELCGHHVHPTADTIFHKSSTPLTLWFYAIYLMSATRAGISAKQLERELGVTYKTAWRMFHQIRKMMSDDDIQLTGEVEVDEMYLQPRPYMKKKLNPQGGLGSNYADNSQTVFGMVERGGRAKVRHVKSAGARVLLPQIEQNVTQGTTIYSDEWASYKKLDSLGYPHETINHRRQVYAIGNVHTQNVENLWSNMKRGLKGVYRHCDAKYLQAYIDEYAFRYSHRKDFQPMFWSLMGRVSRSL